MSSTAQLVVRSAPRVGESLLGFLLRVSDANHYSGAGALVQLANLPRTFLTRPCSLQNLTSLLGDVVSTSQLEALSYWRNGTKNGIKFAGTTVSTVDVNGIHPKVCPTCLREDGIARQMWDLRTVTSCWRHGCYLVDHCSECGSRLTWRRRRLLRCDCGSKLTDQPAVCASAEAAAFTLLLETLLVDGNCWVDPFPIPIRSLAAICKVIWWFGAELGKVVNSQPLAIAKPRACVSAKIVERGNGFLEKWPGSIEELLSFAGRASGAAPQCVSPEHILWRIRQTFRGAEFELMLDDIRRCLNLQGYPVKRNSFYALQSKSRKLRRR
ncbi:TniQ family protein [Bradyrhizobium barranii]|uniref:TniQ family protein n=1 Tax=Bradyrhizobium barranii TaxID=2992140 RepID=UPI001CCD164A